MNFEDTFRSVLRLINPSLLSIIIWFNKSHLPISYLDVPLDFLILSSSLLNPHQLLFIKS